jgi:cell division septation protein DedD
VTGRLRRVLGISLSVLFSAVCARAQQAPPDSIFRRAQRLANEGAGVAARELLDSLVRVSADGSEARAEALFWRATVAADSQSAQADYLTIVVDHALSPRAADALLRLGRFEFEHGDRESARRHLERLVLEHATATAASEGWYWLGRARIQDNDLAGACVALDSALRRLPESDVERRRPVQHYAQPCKNLVVAPVGASARDTTVAAPSKRDTTLVVPRSDSAPVISHRDVPPPARRDSAPAKPKYSVQIAAYDTRSGAEALVKKLTARGYEARVDSLKLFHVRIGMYAARAEAVALVNKLKQQGQTAIVVEVERREP